MIGQYLEIWNLRVQKNPNIEKIIFKVVQMKILAMHINSLYTLTVRNLLNIFMEHNLYLNKNKNDNFDPYSVFLAIATNISQ